MKPLTPPGAAQLAQEHPLAARVHKLFLPACDGGGVQRIAKKDATGRKAAAA